MRNENIPIEESTKVLCGRCHSTLYEKYNENNLYKSLCFALAALILFIPAQLYPVLTFELVGAQYTTTIFESALVLYNLEYYLLALVIVLSAIVFPLINSVLILLIYLQNSYGLYFFQKRSLYKFFLFIKTVSLVEVYLLAFVVAYIKLADISDVYFNTSFYFFIAYIVCYYFSNKTLHFTKIYKFEKKIPESYNISLALVFTGLILYIPANILTMMNISKFGDITPDTILSGVISLIDSDMYLVAIVVFVASIIIPLFKLLGMLFLLLSIRFNFYRNKIMKLRLYRFIESIGKWSILDIYMMGILCAVVKSESVAYIEPGLASVYFTTVVLTTMLATATFDTKLIWNNNE